jgi:hypothetical protein
MNAGKLPKNQEGFSAAQTVRENGRILLANPLQSSSSTFSWGSFLGFFAFKEGMWDTQIAALLSSPTVSARFLHTRHEGQFSRHNLYGNSVHQ